MASRRVWAAPVIAAALAAAALAMAGARGAGAGTLQVEPVTFNTTASTAFTGTVASFFSSRGGAMAADFAVTIDFGDQSGSFAGSISGLGGGFFSAIGTGAHTYSIGGTYAVVVTVFDTVDLSSASTTSTAQVGGAAGVTVFPVTFTVAAGMAFSGVVAIVVDSRPGVTAADLAGNIDWGDGTPATAPLSNSTDAQGGFVINGGHTYAAAGTYQVVVGVTDTGGPVSFDSADSTAQVGAATGLTMFPLTFAATVGSPLSPVQVITFADGRAGALPADFSATIDWGDATPPTPATTIAGFADGGFAILGSHTYLAGGRFPVVVTVTDGVGGLTASGTSFADVAASSGITVFPLTFSATEGVPFSGVVASFHDGLGQGDIASLSATIDWGDGSPATAATSVNDLGSSNFAVNGAHTYAAEGTYTVLVTATDTSPMTPISGSGTGRAQVAENDVLTPQPLTFAAIANQPFSGVVARFSDTYTTNPAAGFSATIDWGDGSAPTAATLITNTGGIFAVSGMHTYSAGGGFTVSVTLVDDPPGTATATAASHASVADGVAQVPTLGWPGLAALGVLVAAAAVILLRRGEVGAAVRGSAPRP